MEDEDAGADPYLVPVLQRLGGDLDAVQEGAVAAGQVLEDVLAAVVADDAGVALGDGQLVEPHVHVQPAAQTGDLGQVDGAAGLVSFADDQVCHRAIPDRSFS